MKRFTVAALMLACLAPSAYAEPAGGAPAPAAFPTAAPAPGIRALAAEVKFDSMYGPSPLRHDALPGAPPKKVGAAMSLGFLGALGGIFVGQAIVGRRAGECPWAPFIGMNLGAVAGAVAGYHLAR